LYGNGAVPPIFFTNFPLECRHTDIILFFFNTYFNGKTSISGYQEQDVAITQDREAPSGKERKASSKE